MKRVDLHHEGGRSPMTTGIDGYGEYRIRTDREIPIAVVGPVG